jgi:integrase
MQYKCAPRIPKYRLHKSSNRAVVRLEGRDIYLGKYGTEESKQKYNQVISEWLVSQMEGTHADLKKKIEGVTINELIISYLDHAKMYYVKNGKPTGETENVKDALRELCQLYGRERAEDFGPISLKTVRQAMIDNGLCRSVINARINRIRRVFKWGVENQLFSATILEALKAVSPLKPGRSEAKESKPIKPVPGKQIKSVLEVAPPQIAAMIRLQLLTGMRPGEVVVMKGSDIQRDRGVWTYIPETHKTEHFGKSRVIYLGPKAQQILSPFLRTNLHQYLFNPQEVITQIRNNITLESKEPLSFPKLKRTHKFNYKRAPHVKYTTNSYTRAIKYAC